MALATIVASLTLISSVIIKLVAFPDQFRINWKRKSTQGVSTLFYILAVISYVLWVIHGIIQKDITLIIGQGLGVVTSGAILVQIFLYRDRK